MDQGQTAGVFSFVSQASFFAGSQPTMIVRAESMKVLTSLSVVSNDATNRASDICSDQTWNDATY
jgi:hypothetical protein